MQRLETEIVDHRRLEFRPSGLFEPAFAKASENALPLGAAMAPSRIELMVDTLGFLECGWPFSTAI
jgi:hypothetical protein